jgi:polyhydroxyalkanoate synthesis repressor PhaR
MLLVKKYPNRRLYDTRSSRYMTLEDLEKIIRSGEDIAVQDAQDGRDLTQEVLTQIILERGNGKILPAALLMRLIRLDDAALGEFLTRYVSWALDMYMQMKQRTTSILPRQLASAPFAAADALARMMLDASPYARYQRPQTPPMPPVSVPEEPPPPPFEDLAPPMPEPAETNVSLQVQQLRSEIEALRASIDSGSVAIPGGISARNAAKKKARAPKKRRS